MNGGNAQPDAGAPDTLVAVVDDAAIDASSDVALPQPDVSTVDAGIDTGTQDAPTDAPKEADICTGPWNEEDGGIVWFCPTPNGSGCVFQSAGYYVCPTRYGDAGMP
jgi:hypothetical protein